MTFVSDLKPRSVWQHFDQILTIPRGSKNEEGMRKYVISIADKNGLSCRVDEAGNVLVRKPAAPGREKVAPLILQAHLDMVNEKSADVEHDFEKDPLIPRREGDLLKASGTTLGADNGIGVATQLAILENPDIEHGPLELLFTVDEETGLTGAAQLQPDFLKGKRLINLDSEEEGAIYVGCAGGAGVTLELNFETEPSPAESHTLELKVAGLRGGHSGVDIQLQRANAIKILARALAQTDVPFQLAHLSGGNKRNAIPREARATLTLQKSQQSVFKRSLEACLKAAADEFGAADPELSWSFSEQPLPPSVLKAAASRQVADLLNGLPHGVEVMSYEIPELVETSENLATVQLEKGKLSIHVSCRSSVASALQAVSGSIISIGHLVGAHIRVDDTYPGWQPNLESPLLALARQIFEEKLGRPAEVKAVHAGLECGLIGETYPDMDMISIGPHIQDPHSPNESVRIPTVSSFWELLITLLERVG